MSPLATCLTEGCDGHLDNGEGANGYCGLCCDRMDAADGSEFDEDEEDWEAEGRRIALEGMDLPDGAYFAMAEELGLDPLDYDEDDDA